MIVCPACMTCPENILGMQFWVHECSCGRLRVELLGEQVHDSFMVNDFLWVFTPEPGGSTLTRSKVGGLRAYEARTNLRTSVESHRVEAVIAKAMRIAQASYVMES